MDQTTHQSLQERGTDMPRPAVEKAKQITSDVQDFVADRPYATIAAAALTAFAIGALWKLGHRSPSRYESLKARFPDAQDFAKYLPRQWR